MQNTRRRSKGPRKGWLAHARSGERLSIACLSACCKYSKIRTVQDSIIHEIREVFIVCLFNICNPLTSQLRELSPRCVSCEHNSEGTLRAGFTAVGGGVRGNQNVEAPISDSKLGLLLKQPHSLRPV
jgi:hypothetical protein